MMTYRNKNGKTKAIGSRYGILGTGRGTEHGTPATVPYISKLSDARVALDLYSRGAEIPALVLPLTRYREVNSALAPLTGLWTGQRTLESASYTNAPLIINDIESEAFSFGCRARIGYQDKLTPPESVKKTILNVGMTSDKSSGRLEYSKGWRILREQYGLAGFRAWQEGLQVKTGSPIFMAPTPMIRDDVNSVSLAFDIGKELLNTVETQAFEGLGLELLLHSEIMNYDPQSEQARKRIIESILSMTKGRSPPTGTPFISMKLYDSGHLVGDTNSRNARTILGEFLMDTAEAVRKVGGIFILHNFGVWALAGLDCGADFVSFRTDGEKFKIDPIWRSNSKRKRKAPEVQPFNSNGLCNDNLKNFKRDWERSGAFVTPTHVHPYDYWTQQLYKQQEYRTSLIMDSLLDLGKEYRDAFDGEIPIKDAVSSRVSRMKEQDAMYDMCPSLGTH